MFLRVRKRAELWGRKNCSGEQGRVVGRRCELSEVDTCPKTAERSLTDDSVERAANRGLKSGTRTPNFWRWSGAGVRWAGEATRATETKGNSF